MNFIKMDILAESFPYVVSDLSYVALSVRWQIYVSCVCTGGPIQLYVLLLSLSLLLLLLLYKLTFTTKTIGW